MSLAAKWPIEIICADSRTIYKGANIGTAKPSANDQEVVRHWGLDLVEPGQRYNVYDFKTYAQKAIKNIVSRGKIPLIVGGSGLYIDSLLYDYELGPGYEPGLRKELNDKTVKQLQKDILSSGHKLPTDPLNKRRLIRVIETQGQNPAKNPLSKSMFLFGVWPADEELKKSISDRVEAMFELGFGEEVSGLLRQYGKQAVKDLGIGYKLYIEDLEDKRDLETTKSKIITADWQYSKRQRTWFKRNKDTDWSSTSSECYNKVIQFLNKNCSN